MGSRARTKMKKQAKRMCQMLVLFFLSSSMSVSGEVDGQVPMEQFKQGENVTLSTPGDTQDGCKFVYQDPYTDTTCCYSARSRGETLCDPTIQSSGCRKGQSFRVVEEVVEDHRVISGCRLHMVDIQLEDGGNYLVIFPARLADNMRMEVKVKKKPAKAGSSIYVIGVIAGLLCLIVVAVIVLKIYKRKKQAGEAGQDQEDSDYEPANFVTRLWPRCATWDYWGRGTSAQTRTEEIHMDRFQGDSRLLEGRINEMVEKHAKEMEMKHTRDMVTLKEDIKVLKSQHEEDIGRINKLVKKQAKELAEVRTEMQSLKS